MNNTKREQASINYNMIKYMSKQKKIASNAKAKGFDISSLRQNQKLLLKIYSLSQNENSLEYKNIHEMNEEFHKSYTFYKELTKNKYNLLLTFEDLILDYKQKGYKIPDFSTKHNLFSQSPLLLSSFNKIKMYYKYNKFNEEKLENFNALEKLKEIESSKKKNKNKNNNNNNDNDIVIKLNEGEKTYKYLSKLDEYLIEQNFSQMLKNKNKKNNNNNNNNDNKNNTNKTLNKRRSSIDKSMILLRMEDIQREKRNSISINNIKLLKAKRNSIKSLLSENIITDSGIDKLKKEINQLKNCLKEYEEEEDRYKKNLSAKNKTKINFLKHFKFAYNFKKKGITPKFLNLSIFNNNNNQNKDNSKELSESKNSNTLTINNVSKNEINMNSKSNTIEAISNRSLKNKTNYFSIKFKKNLSRNINNLSNSNNFFKTQSTNYNNISTYRSNISDYSHKSMNKSEYLNTFYELTKKQILNGSDIKNYLIKYNKDFNNNNLNIDNIIQQEINTKNIYNNVGKLQKKINDKEEFFLNFPILTANNKKNIKIIKNLDKQILNIDKDLVKGAIKVKFNS